MMKRALITVSKDVEKWESSHIVSRSVDGIATLENSLAAFKKNI
jgi:hypothetical protein